MLHEVITAQSIKRLCFVLSRQSPGLHHEVMFRMTNVCTNSILYYLTSPLSTFTDRIFGGEEQEKKFFFSPRCVKIEALTHRAREGQYKYGRVLSSWSCSDSKIYPMSTIHYCLWRRVVGTSTAQLRLDWFKKNPHIRHTISLVSSGQSDFFYFDFLRHLSGFKSFWNCMWILW